MDKTRIASEAHQKKATTLISASAAKRPGRRKQFLNTAGSSPIVYV